MSAAQELDAQMRVVDSDSEMQKIHESLLLTSERLNLLVYERYCDGDISAEQLQKIYALMSSWADQFNRLIESLRGARG